MSYTYVICLIKDFRCSFDHMLAVYNDDCVIFLNFRNIGRDLVSTFAKLGKLTLCE